MAQLFNLESVKGVAFLAIKQPGCPRTLGVQVLTAIRDPRWAIAYLLVFGVGTIAGMMLITGAMALPFVYADKRLSRLNPALRVA